MHRRFWLVVSLLSFSYCFLVPSFGWALDAGTVTVTVTIDQSVPTLNPIVGPTLTVSVHVASKYELRGVHAQVDSVSFDLAAVGPGVYLSSANIDALPRGLKTLVVTATDLLSETGTASATFLHDDPPVITVTSPLGPSVARPTVHVVATCSDDDNSNGCTLFELTAAGSKSASGASTIDSTLDLGIYEGSEVGLNFFAQDSVGQRTTVGQNVFVDTSTALKEVSTVPGAVFDFDGRRVLYRKPDDALVIRRLADSSDLPIGKAQAYRGISEELYPWGFLTSNGAVWQSVDPPSDCNVAQTPRMFEWRDNGPANMFKECGQAVVSGDYAHFGSTDQEVVRNLTTGTNTVLAPWPAYQGDTGIGSAIFYTLAPNGDAYGVGEDVSTPKAPYSCPVLRNRQGQLVQIGTIATCRPARIISDGTNLVYSDDANSINLLSADGLVTTLSVIGSRIETDGWYAVSNGWVAFMKKSSANVNQVWVRSPTGVLNQLTIFGSDSVIESLNSVGEVMFKNGNHRYFASASSTPLLVSSTLGRSVSQCGAWYVILGNTVFQYPFGVARRDGAEVAPVQPAHENESRGVGEACGAVARERADVQGVRERVRVQRALASVLEVAAWQRCGSSIRSAEAVGNASACAVAVG